jgi:hypothetical protein
MQRQGSGSWFAVGGYTVVGTVLLWWANDQLTAIRLISGSTFEYPEGRLLLRLITLIAAGIAWGFAVAAGQQGTSHPRIGVLALWSLLPLSIVAYFYLQITFGWPPGLGRAIFTFVFNDSTIVSSAIVFGFFVAGMTAHLLRRRGKDDVGDTESGRES